MAEKCINCMSARPTPPHTNPMELGPGTTFLARNRKKIKRIMILDPKKGGVSFFSIFLTPPPPPPSKPQNNAFQVGGGVGGSKPKTQWGLLDKIMILQGVKQTIQPLEVGYTNSPKKAQKGGYVAFPPIYAPAWL